MNFPGWPEELDWPVDFDVEADLLLEDDDNPGMTRGAKLSIVQGIVFPFLVDRGVSQCFHSYEFPCAEQSFPSDRTGGVSSSNCTVPNRSRSWTYTCASSFVCTSPFAVTTVVSFWTISKYPVHLSVDPSGSACALALPNQQTYDLLCFWRLAPVPLFHKRIERSFVCVFWACIYFRQIPRCIVGTIFLSWGFLNCSFLKLSRARISLMSVSPFWITPRVGPLVSRIRISYQVRPENLRCVPPKRSLSFAQLSV